MLKGGRPPVCVGDFITLFSEDRFGYIFNYSSSCCQDELGVYADQDKDSPILPTPFAAVFEVFIEQKYKLQKKYQGFKAASVSHEADLKYLAELAGTQKAAELEEADNQLESRRQQGKPIMYGQKIQLKHKYTEKWLNVSPIKTSATETSNVSVNLRSANGKTCLFRIMPRYKVKNEGDPVEVGDQIIIESIKSTGSFLHVSRFTFPSESIYTDSYEVNLSLSSSGFSINRFSRPPSKQEQQLLTGGTIVRFYHLELEAYLTVEGIDQAPGFEPHLRVRRQDPSNPKTLYSSTSAITYWQIEKEAGILNGHPISAGDKLKLRHAVRRKYLTITSEGLLGMTEDGTDPAALFKLVPVSEGENELMNDSGVRIQHCETSLWIYGTNEVFHSRKKVPGLSAMAAAVGQTAASVVQTGEEEVKWTKAHRQKLDTGAVMMYNDAFSIQPISDSGIRDLNFVSGLVPFFHKLAHDITKDKSFSSASTSALERGLCEAEEFMLVDDKPKKTRQKLFRNFQIVDLVVSLLKMRKPKSEKMDSVFFGLIKILSAYLRGSSRKNERYMGRHMDFFLSQISEAESSIGVAMTIMAIELLTDNRRLVDLISIGQIQKICALLRNQKNHRYLTFLSALCVCDGVCLTENQNTICEELFSTKKRKTRFEGDCFIKTAIGQDIERRKNVIYVLAPTSTEWEVLSDFTKTSYGSNDYLFLKSQLELYSKLCAGRNCSAVDLFTEELKLISWQECYLCIIDRHLHDEIRAAYIRLMYDLFINVGTNLLPTGSTKLVFSYREIKVTSSDSTDTASSVNPFTLLVIDPPPLQRNLRLYPTILNNFKPLPLVFVEPIKDWISHFLVENDCLIASEVARNTLITEVLVLVRRLTLLGYYEDFDEIKGVLNPIIGLLDGDDDLPFKVADGWDEETEENSELRTVIENYRLAGRYVQNAQNLAIAGVKIHACYAVNLLFNLKSSVRLEKFMSMFKGIQLNPGNALHNMLSEDCDIENLQAKDDALKKIEQMFSRTDYVGTSFVNVGLELCRYEFEELVAEAMFLVHRSFSSYEELFDAALKIQILISDESCQADETVRGNVRQCRLMMASKLIDQENGNQFCRLMDELTSLCYLKGDPTGASHPINQQIMTHHGVVEDLVEIATGNVEATPDARQSVMSSTFSLLRALARNNKSVQKQLFALLPSLQRKETEEYLSDLATEIFTGNAPLCSQIPSQFIFDTVSLLSETRSPSLIQLLLSIVEIRGKPMKRNQSLVVRALLMYKDSVSILTEHTSEERMELLRGAGVNKSNVKAVEFEQRYLANMIQLLTLCAKGGNKTAEPLCQSIFSFDELIDIMVLPNLNNDLKGPFLEFACEIFLSAGGAEAAKADPSANPAHDPKTWAFIDMCGEKLRQAMLIVSRDPELATRLLKAEGLPIGTSTSQTEAEAEATIRFIFEGILPFVQFFFQHFYEDDLLNMDSESTGRSLESADRAERFDATNAQRQIANQLLTGSLVPFARTVHKSITKTSHLMKLTSCINSVVDSVNPSLEIPDYLYSLSTIDAEDPLAVYSATYEKERNLNTQLCNFVLNLKAAYGGKNTVSAQLDIPGFEDRPYCDWSLPLSGEFQGIVNVFMTRSEEEDGDETSDIICSQRTRELIKFLDNSQVPLSIGTGLNDNLKKSEKTQIMILHSLRILRGILWNAIVVMPDEEEVKPRVLAAHQEYIEALQENFVDMGIINAIAEFCNSLDEAVSQESFELIAVLCYGGNKTVQDSFMAHFQGSREENFFICLKRKMLDFAERLKEYRGAANSKSSDRKNMLKIKDKEKETSKSQNNLQKKHPPNLILEKVDLETGIEEDGEFVKETTLQKVLKAIGLVKVTEPPRKKIVDENMLRVRKSAYTQRQDLSDPILTGQDESVTEYVAESQQRTYQDLMCILKVLARLCDGGNVALQDYIRNQHDNLKNMDIVAETANFIHLLSTNLTSDSIDLLVQLMDTFVEVVQGNEENQQVLFDKKVIDCINMILLTCESSRDSVPLHKIYQLYHSIGVFLKQMVEENRSTELTSFVVTALNKETACKVAERAFLDTIENDDEKAAIRDEIIETAFTYHHLMCRAMDLDPKIKLASYMSSDACAFFTSHTSSVEFVKDDSLQRVYFKVEDHAVLRESVKERIKWEIDRTSARSKHRDFMAWAKEVYSDVRYQRKVQSFPLFRALVNSWGALNTLMLLLTYTITVVVLLGWMAPERFSGWDIPPLNETDIPFATTYSPAVGVIVSTLGTAHILCCLLILLSFILAERPTVPNIVKTAWRFVKYRGQPPEYIHGGLNDVQTSYLSINLFSWNFLYYVLLFLLSILGTTLSASFFGFHTLHIATQNQLLRRVVLAVTLNGSSMLWVCFLGILLFYVYALIGFLLLRNVFFGNDLHCVTLFECFITTVRNGLMTGMSDNFEIPERVFFPDRDNTGDMDFYYYLIKAIYDISFFALITTIGLNIIFGITIDTFSQLRENKAQIEEDMRSTCFICNLAAFELEHHGSGFESHVIKEHNMWAYLFFFIYLAETPNNDLSALELYVFELICRENLDFFPLGKALCIVAQEVNNEEDTRLSIMSQQMKVIMDRFEKEDKKQLDELKMKMKEKLEEEKLQQAKAKKSDWSSRLRFKKGAKPDLNELVDHVVRRHHAMYGLYRFPLE